MLISSCCLCLLCDLGNKTRHTRGPELREAQVGWRKAEQLQVQLQPHTNRGKSADQLQGM